MQEIFTESLNISTLSKSNNLQLIIKRLGEHVAEVEGFSRGLSEMQLKERASPDGWSMHEIVVHLVERQDVFVERLAQMLEKDSPRIQPYSGGQNFQNGFYASQNFSFQLRMFREQRETLVALLQCLEMKQWEREGEHPSIKHYTVEKCMESLMRYEEYRLNEIFNLFFGVKE